MRDKIPALNVVVWALIVGISAELHTGLGARFPASSQRAAGPEDEQIRGLLPGEETYTADERAKQFGRHQVTPFGRKEMAFELLLPRGWESQVEEVDPETLGQVDQRSVPLLSITPSGSEEVTVHVHCIRRPAEVTPAQIMDRAVERNGWKPVVRHSLEIKGRRAEEALVRAEDEDQGLVYRRVTMVRSGDFIYVIVATVVETRYEIYKRQLGVVATSFNVLS